MKMTSKLVIAAICGLLMFSYMNNATEAAPAKGTIDYTVKGPSGEPKVFEDELARLHKLVEQNPGDAYAVFIDNEKRKARGRKLSSPGMSPLHLKPMRII
ncbi:hypothetical protein AZ66_18960 [Paenibacillus sp. E194]|uniref:hypothetical protein n=1 Tax=Paenibacillus sp. E194 TaxID=1458845 RepID=UPI0005DFB4BB|nr:hypothetical protein [Paenibacillus sp. E194]KJB86410.1 hypothetical protein AZ66_18960 [Paenibacillus sp. E194]